MDLEALALFHSDAGHGGFGRAARATGRAKATLSRRVSDLERQLGVRLFERGAGLLRLTEEGRALLASTQEPLGELAAAESAVRQWWNGAARTAGTTGSRRRDSGTWRMAAGSSSTTSS